MRYKTEKEVSSGGVVNRPGTKSVVLICRKNFSVWCLPKGKVEKGETFEDAAVREIKEETGIVAKIARYLDEVHYWYSDAKRKLRLDKTVHFFLLTYKNGDIGTHDREVDTVEWFDIDTAIGRATYETERKILLLAKKILEKGINKE
ncbi:MAG: NUDIX hydrolase [Candidatus Omnitrophica bacterium]|nr:NUDIX hydrolase [Candidatus Omnitrophota bacterium]